MYRAATFWLKMNVGQSRSTQLRVHSCSKFPASARVSDARAAQRVKQRARPNIRAWSEPFSSGMGT